LLNVLLQLANKNGIQNKNKNANLYVRCVVAVTFFMEPLPNNDWGLHILFLGDPIYFQAVIIHSANGGSVKDDL
jgi:hypothetical protein